MKQSRASTGLEACKLWCRDGVETDWEKIWWNLAVAISKAVSELEIIIVIILKLYLWFDPF